MRKTAVLIFILLSFSTPFSNAQEKFSVSGEVVYSGIEKIYVCLHTMETFENCLTALPPEKFVEVINGSSTGKVIFKIGDVPRGEYVLMVFVDKNGNGKFDLDTWGNAKEPISMHKQFEVHGLATMRTNWDRQKFKVDKDVTGIEIKF